MPAQETQLSFFHIYFCALIEFISMDNDKRLYLKDESTTDTSILKI